MEQFLVYYTNEQGEKEYLYSIYQTYTSCVKNDDSAIKFDSADDAQAIAKVCSRLDAKQKWKVGVRRIEFEEYIPEGKHDEGE